MTYQHFEVDEREGVFHAGVKFSTKKDHPLLKDVGQARAFTEDGALILLRYDLSKLLENHDRKAAKLRDVILSIDAHLRQSQPNSL